MGRRPSTEPRGTHAGQFVPARREGELHKSFSEGGGEGRREGRRKGKEKECVIECDNEWLPTVRVFTVFVARSQREKTSRGGAEGQFLAACLR